MKLLITSMVVLMAISVCTTADAGHHKKKEDKKGILLVTFGTSDSEAKKAFENIERLTKKRFKKTEVRWAFTSIIIRRKLAKQGINLDSPAVALAKMYDEGFTHVAVQSLHCIGGAEYDDLKNIVSKFETGTGAFKQIVLGGPLLNSFDDLQKTAKCLLTKVPSKRKADEAVIFMGHGSEHHYSDLAYVAAYKVFNDLDKNAFVGTVEGKPTIDDVLAGCKKAGIKKAYLMPLMSVAGDHAKNDMAGDEDDSWKSILKKNGIESVSVLKGIAEFDSVANIWVDHLETAIKSLD